MEINRYAVSCNIERVINFAHISDLHDTEYGYLFNIINSLSPDFIAITGDAVHNNIRYKNGISALKSLTNICPVFFSLGNHEALLGTQIFYLLKSSSVHILNNSHIFFNGIKIGGLTSGYFDTEQKMFKSTPIPDINWLSKFEDGSSFKLLLCHHPEYYIPYIKDKKVNLILSGHAHGGQWRFFGRGVFAPGQGIFPKYTSGIYDKRLIVNRGASNPISIPRINNKTEIGFISLIPNSKK